MSELLTPSQASRTGLQLDGAVAYDAASGPTPQNKPQFQRGVHLVKICESAIHSLDKAPCISKTA